MVEAVAVASNPSNLGFPKRPQRSAKAAGRSLKLYSNFFNLEFASPEIKGVYKYQTKFEPEVPDNSHKLRKEIIAKARDAVKEKLNFHIQWGAHLYSTQQCTEAFSASADIEGVTYKVTVECVQMLETLDKDYQQFLKIFFNSMMRTLRFETIGRKSFNQHARHSLEAHKIQVWPGFDARLVMKEQGVFLNIDICHKVVRSDTALQNIQQVKETALNKNLDFKQEITTAMTGTTVVTSYNNRTYRVTSVDFEKSPQSTFEKDDKQVSFAEYYKEKYKLTVTQEDQPMLLYRDEKTNRETYLIPEFCQMTGLSDAMRANFRLMKDLGAITHSDAQRKVQECRNLFEVFDKNERCLKKMKEWQLQFKHIPASIEGFKFDAGRILLGSKGTGDRASFDIESSGRDMDRKVQDKMYEQPEFKTWGIFYPERDEKVAKDFYNTIERSLQLFGFTYAKPALFKLQGNPQRFDTWEKSLRANLRPGVQAIVCLMPGQKSKCPIYDDLKRTLLSELPVVSQGVLINTIAKGKNIRSIVNAILIQLCAKLGGVPWAVDALPFMDEPTMVCGLDVFHSTALGKKSVMGFCASSNSTATQFWSTSKVHEDVGEEMSKQLGEVMTKAIENFKKANGATPKNIIIYRDGVGEGQSKAVCTVEMEQINAAIAAAGAECKCIYINVNKRINTRVFAGGDAQGSFKNPLPGTVIDQGITERDLYEFFLVSTSARQGLVAPTRYSILYDSTGASPDKIELLTYKLCFTYYNVSGSIKVPAPIQYAHRLAALVGERGTRHQAPPKVHEAFENKEASLYFI